MNTWNKNAQPESQSAGIKMPSTDAENQSLSLIDQDQNRHEKTTTARQQFSGNTALSTEKALLSSNEQSSCKYLFSDYGKAPDSLAVRPLVFQILSALVLAFTYRIPKSVTKVRIHRDRNCFAVCPRCNNSIEYEYQLYCGCCGQHLEWSLLDEAEEEYIGWDGKDDD